MREPVPIADLMSVAEAVAVLDAEPVTPADAVRLSISDAAGLRLAEPLVADRDYPPFDKSLLDGVAVRSADAGEARRVVGEVAAGEVGRAVGPGEAVRIMTGAPLPPGADAVVPIERCVFSDEIVRFDGDASAGAGVARRASDRSADTILLPAGTRLAPAALAAASAVTADVLVVPPPRVALFVTGNEVAAAGQAPDPTQTRDAVGPPVAALLRALGCAVTWSPEVLPDDPAALRAAVERALADHNAVVLSGGMSMGAYDFVPAMLDDLGFEARVRKVRMRPGKPFGFWAGRGPTDGKLAFGLPGNPVSAFVCTLRLTARPLVRLAGGAPSAELATRPAPLAEPLPTPNGSREFCQPCRLTPAGVTPLPWRGSADVFTLAQADALLIRPEQDPPHPAGGVVQVLPLR